MGCSLPRHLRLTQSNQPGNPDSYSHFADFFGVSIFLQNMLRSLWIHLCGQDRCLLRTNQPHTIRKVPEQPCPANSPADKLRKISRQ
jgi:hypothetical protein